MFRSVSMIEGYTLEPADIRLPELNQEDDQLALDIDDMSPTMQFVVLKATYYAVYILASQYKATGKTFRAFPYRSGQ